jgi:hypothetical protein
MLFDPNNKIKKPLRCLDCGADMDFLASQLNGRVFLSTLLERNFFVCPDCGRLSHEMVAWPKEFIRFEAVQIFTDDLAEPWPSIKNWPGAGSNRANPPGSGRNRGAT